MVFQLLLTHLCVPKSERLDLKFPVALLCSAYLIHGLKPVATNMSPLWGWSGNIYTLFHLLPLIDLCVPKNERLDLKFPVALLMLGLFNPRVETRGYSHSAPLGVGGKHPHSSSSQLLRRESCHGFQAAGIMTNIRR
jgi:hypothetical protein